MSSPGRFEVVCEVSPPRRPDLAPIQSQVRSLAPVSDAFLVPDNHLGRAALSGLAVAREISGLGGRSILCLNSRDRNLLGVRRDLLTAGAYGIDRLLCVRGDAPSAGTRAGDLTVARMIEEVRSFGSGPEFSSCPPFQVGAAAQLGPLPAWKRDADFLFTQVSFSSGALRRWRDSVDAGSAPVYAGVLVLHSARIAAALPGLGVPAALAGQVRLDPAAGIGYACGQVADLLDHGGFAGVHLIALTRFPEVAGRLAAVLPSLQPAAR